MNPDNEDMQEGEDNESAENQGGDNSQEGVVIPEEFQKKVHALVHNAPKHHLAHIRDRVSSREDELRKAEREKEMKSMKGKQKEFSTDAMPASY